MWTTKVALVVLLALFVADARRRHHHPRRSDLQAEKPVVESNPLNFDRIKKWIVAELENPEFKAADSVKKILDVLELRNPPKSDIEPFFTPSELTELQAVTNDKLAIFVEEMVSCATKNPILHTLLQRLNSGGWTMEEHDDGTTTLKDNKFRAEIVPSAVAYAFVLDAMNRKVAENPAGALSALIEHYKNLRLLNPEWGSFFGVFPWSKLLAVEYALEKARDALQDYVDSAGKTQIDPTTGDANIPLNILEAIAADYWLGHRENGNAGFSLARANPGHKEFDPDTEAGPTEVTDSAILYRYPLPTSWDNLYSSWNLAFVSQFPTFPHFFAKLLNPSVGCYYDKPNEYIFFRGVALYTHVHFVLFNRIANDDDDQDAPVMYNFHKLFVVRCPDHPDSTFVDLWGATNHLAGKAYTRLLKQTKREMSFFENFLTSSKKLSEIFKDVMAATSRKLVAAKDHAMHSMLMFADSFVLEDEDSEIYSETDSETDSETASEPDITDEDLDSAFSYFKKLVD
eukprot:gnl/Spiro4/4512_TR2242_c0_g1_i1.p1 gnl/Spiro4/4512_TR2242_c0_g1~~gnl/Spiro4/4512_TR2242_c0_g1_i1.p1  ORF type:complete len:527 (-),score=159.42 gnl/Spiro4/4512_TR2242_c0_g1_i1:142-1683(-)